METRNGTRSGTRPSVAENVQAEPAKETFAQKARNLIYIGGMAVIALGLGTGIDSMNNQNRAGVFLGLVIACLAAVIILAAFIGSPKTTVAVNVQAETKAEVKAGPQPGPQPQPRRSSRVQLVRDIIYIVGGSMLALGLGTGFDGLHVHNVATVFTGLVIACLSAVIVLAAHIGAPKVAAQTVNK